MLFVHTSDNSAVKKKSPKKAIGLHGHMVMDKKSPPPQLSCLIVTRELYCDSGIVT